MGGPRDPDRATAEAKQLEALVLFLVEIRKTLSGPKRKGIVDQPGLAPWVVNALRTMTYGHRDVAQHARYHRRAVAPGVGALLAQSEVDAIRRAVRPEGWKPPPGLRHLAAAESRAHAFASRLAAEASSPEMAVFLRIAAEETLRWQDQFERIARAMDRRAA